MKPAKLFKKASKLGSKKSKKGKASAFDWPSGTRIGFIGHANSGKTVYFTVLNEECKISRDLQLSITDTKTSSYLLANRRSIWGLGSTSQVGTVVDMQGEREFPKPNETDISLVFSAILDGRRKVPVVSYDYPGETLAINTHSEAKDKLLDFVSGCDGLVFFYDPKIMGSELENQGQVAAFVSIVEGLAKGHSRLPIPIALVINKAEILPGFKGDDQVITVSAEDEHLLSEDFDLFLNRILNSIQMSSDSEWTGSVRKVLVRLSDFLRVVVGRTLDFQIFFVSNTGVEPEKVGTDVGRSLYRPPAKIQPTGVKAPLYWLLNQTLLSKRISKFRSAARIVAMVSLICAGLVSIPYLIHLEYQLPRARAVERNVLTANSGNVRTAPSAARKEIVTAFNGYKNSLWVRSFFTGFRAPSITIANYYQNFNLNDAVLELDALIGQLDAYVADSSRWPKFNPAADSLVVSDDLTELIDKVSGFHVGDSTSDLFHRSERILAYWQLLGEYVTNSYDTVTAKKVFDQIEFDSQRFPAKRSAAERQLAATMQEKLQGRKQVQEQKVVAQKAAFELDDLVAEINGNNDAKFRLSDAVTRLRRVKRDLDATVDAKAIRMIDKYILEVQKWEKTQRFKYRVEKVDAKAHIHIDIKPRGESPTWSYQSQLFAGAGDPEDPPLEWKAGDVIRVAIDEMGADCNWGATASATKVLDDKYSIFDLEKEISFESLGKTAKVSFIPALTDRLPKLEMK